jgi:selenocysteine lyase/cysteine desulfurase
MVGLGAALDFFHAIGPERIYARLHELATRVRQAVQRYPQLRLANASADVFYGGLVSFERSESRTGGTSDSRPSGPSEPRQAGAPTGDLSRIVEQCAARNIRIAGGPERMRIATHIFTQPTELNAFFDALDAGLRA